MNANSYDTPGRAGGNREDLRDVLTILEPEETPFTSMCKKGPTPTSTLVEVLSTRLRAARKTGSKEGQDAGKGNNKAKNRTRWGVYSQRIQDEFGVTDVQQAISRAGGTAAVSNEYANDKAQTIREMKRDIEAINCSTNEHNGGNENDMTTRGAFTHLDPAGGTLQTTAPLIPDNFRCPSGNIVSGASGSSGTCFTEAQLNGILKSLKSIYGGKQTYQFIGGNNHIETVDNFTRVNSSTTNARYSVREDAGDHEITLYVKVFESSFGRVELIPTEFNNVSSAGVADANASLILNMDLWEIDQLDALHAVDQEENAGGKSGYAKAIWALLCLNPRGNGKIYNTGA